jgi:uncharacterized damage-inducible protein DinB
MADTILGKLFEHNNWANNLIIRACLSLSTQQLDAEPASATQGSIRSTLLHMVTAQQGYLRLLTVPLDERLEPVGEPPFDALLEMANRSGGALLAMTQDASGLPTESRIQTRDGFLVDPWVLMVQVINHASEHREQLKSMMSALGVTPPNIDGWDYGEWSRALEPVEAGSKQ